VYLQSCVPIKSSEEPHFLLLQHLYKAVRRRMGPRRSVTTAMHFESATVVMLASVVMHSLQVSAFQMTFLPSAATCGPNRGGRCGIGAMQQRCGLHSGSRGMLAAMSSPGIPPQEQQGPTFFAALWYIHTHTKTHTHSLSHTHTHTH
jgi:hypothetical protein